MFLPVVLIAVVLTICLVIARVTGGRARRAGRLSPEAAAAAVARHPAARSRRARSGRAGRPSLIRPLPD